MKRFNAWINPLAFHALDEPWAPKNEKPSYEDFLRFICSPNPEFEIDDLINRYREISIESKRLSVVPAEANLLEKLVWPLKHAKSSFMIGNYLGTVSLCGMVAEMIALLTFDMSELTVNGRPMTEGDQKSLFGSAFEKLGQERRVSVLRSYDLIDDDSKLRFDLIREKRRRYLHFYSAEHGDLKADSIRVFDATVSLVVTIMGLSFSEGKVILSNALIKYLENRGIVHEAPDEGAAKDQEHD